ncbi:MAG: DUF192 domain-containing protein [Negativicutes bacterium]|nr:DUF192 domain-containing protein [Negativicutes bacterium]
METRKLAVNGRVVAGPVWLADRFLTRLRGLIGRPPLAGGHGLAIVPCRGVHTWFMRYPIDVIFVDRNRMVVRVVTGLPPWRSAWCRKGEMVVEMAAGAAGQLGIKAGDRLELR